MYNGSGTTLESPIALLAVLNVERADSQTVTSALLFKQVRFMSIRNINCT